MFVPYTYDDADPSWPKKRLQPGQPVHGAATIGFGHTGKYARPGNEISFGEGKEIMRQDLVAYEDAVEAGVKVHLNENQFAALVSFAFNVGVDAFLGSTLLKRLNKGEYDAVPYELLKWNKTTIKGKKVKSTGLVNRRNKEIGLWGDESEVAPSSTPAATMKKSVITKESVAVTAVSASGAATMADRLGIIDMFSGSGPVQYALAAILVICFGAAAYWFLKKRL